jgi:hypothetical protein
LPVLPRISWLVDRPCQLVGFLEDNSTLVTKDVERAEELAAVRLWDTETGTQKTALVGRDGDSASYACLNPDGRAVLVCWRRSVIEGTPEKFQVRLHRTRDWPGRVLLTTDRFALGSGASLALSPDGRTLAHFRSDAISYFAVDLWDCERQERLASLAAWPPMASSSDGRWFAAVALPNGLGMNQPPLMVSGVHVWDSANGRAAVYPITPTQQASLQFNQRGGSLLAVANGCELAIWDVAVGRSLARRPAPFDALLRSEGKAGLATWDSPDGAGHLGWPGWDSDELWDFGVRVSEPGECRSPAQLSADGGTVAVAASRLRLPVGVSEWMYRRTGVVWFMEDVGRVRLFSALDGRHLGCVPGRWVVFSQDGRAKATIDGQMVRIWDIPLHKPLAWLLAGSVLWSLPVALLARRRVRRLRRARVRSRSAPA